ncbi:MAG TPA: reverse transcriptase-like protein, partial [bacterium]
EGLGFTGTEEGIAAQAVCLLIKDDFEEAEKASKKKSAEKKPVKKKEKEAMPVLPEITPGSIDKCVVYTDGATDINPGPSGIGLVFEYPDGKVFAKYAEFIGDGTNNQAEYKAALAAAEICLKWKIKEVEFRTDSDLMANQVNGRWKVKNEDLAILLMKLREYLGGLKKWRMVYVPREKNTAADKLSKLALQSEQG